MSGPVLPDTGVRIIHVDELKAALERAAEMGARKALEGVGLHDAEAGKDVRDLRELLDAWRSARSTVWRTILKVSTTAALVALGAGLAVKLKIGG
ncbi:DUF6127 family protein [Ferrovibrio sp.]|uniref:DUF6127 family protein n=1 Tax=Ferrovibrio sp. TaxID=1917215 RepID=UPI003D0BEFFE